MKATISAKQLARLVGATKQFIGAAGGNRPAHQHIRLEFKAENTSVTAVAVDGYTLSVEHGICNAIDEDFVAYILPEVPKHNKDDVAEIEVSDDMCFIRIENRTIGFKQSIGEFMDWESAIPAGETIYKIGFNPDLLLKALQAAKVSVGGTFKEAMIIEFRDPLSPVVLRTNEQDIKLVLPLRIKDRR